MAKPADPFADLFQSLSRYYPGSRRLRGSTPGAVIEPEWTDEKPLLKRINGHEVEMYTVGALARAINKSVYSVRLYEKNGYLPSTPYRTPSRVTNGVTRTGRRLYTRDMVAAVVDVLAAQGLLNAPRIDWGDYPDLPEEIAKRWREIQSRLSTK